MKRRAEIIAIGSELLTPSRMDTNSLWLTEQLNNHGIEVWQKHIVGDNKENLVSLFKEAIQRSDFVLTSGGLGPTFDDITREAFSEATELPLVYHDSIWKMICKSIRRRDFTPPENNRRQAFAPEGSRSVLNPVGTAPGIIAEINGTRVALLPGPPPELKGVFTRMTRWLFNQHGETPVHTKVFKMTLIPESHAESLLADLEIPDNAEWSILANLGQVEAHVRVKSADISEAESVFDRFEKELKERVGQRYFATGSDSIESIVASLLMDNGHTISVAESCTGGLLGKRLTDLSGSSSYMAGGIISYSNQAKMDLLGVPGEDIEKYGAVSKQVALQMARGVKRQLDTTHGISITGVAGPTGGTEAKPVGTVFIALVDDQDNQVCYRFNFLWKRDVVRIMSTQAALEMIRLQYSGAALDTVYLYKG